MANLDDFFKKKDTKKSKGKKFAVNNPLSLNVSDVVNKNGKGKQEKPTSFESSLSTNENDLFSNQNTDEWKDFVEEEKRDYSGLKIQNLQLNDEDPEKQHMKQHESEEEPEVDEQGQAVVKKSGPWKKIQEQKKREVKPSVVEEKKPENTGYIPPHLRASVPKRPINKKTTPSDLSSEELFPALGATASKARITAKTLN